MKHYRFGLWIVAACAALPVHAENFKDYPDLPPLNMVVKSMADNPMTLAAQAGIKVEQANLSRLEAGPYEYSVRLGALQRSVRTDPSQRFNEWDVALERPFRLPGKAAMDAEIGTQGVAQARLAHGDALHEAGRGLLKAWFAWVRERYQVKQWQEQVDVLKNQLAIVNKRIKAGDAPKLEGLLSEAAVAQAESSLQQARLRERVAANDLTQRFPGIVTPEKVQLTTPTPLPNDLLYWREQVLQHNHELGLARAEVKRWQLMASRTQADQMPDPSLGIRYANERGGEERLVGLSISMPLPGQARRAATESVQAHGEVVVQKEAMVLAKVSAEIANNYASARASFESWQKSREAADRMKSNAQLMSRAYSLGEANLWDTLIAERQSIESGLGATLAQIEAAESRYRLMLDAHQLWPIDVDEDDEWHQHP